MGRVAGVTRRESDVSDWDTLYDFEVREQELLDQRRNLEAALRQFTGLIWESHEGTGWVETCSLVKADVLEAARKLVTE